MPKRTIKTALGTYRSKDGAAGAFGFQGQEVDVHPDDVARFDELNVQPGGEEPHVPPRQDVYLVSPGAANSGTDSGLNTTVTEEEAAESTAEEDAKQDEAVNPKRGRSSK